MPPFEFPFKEGKVVRRQGKALKLMFIYVEKSSTVAIHQMILNSGV